MSSQHIAIDLGADSGRVVLGTLDRGVFELTVVHRFVNTPVRIDGLLRWDLPALWDGIRTGIRLAREQATGPVASIGVDTWGVDYALLDEAGTLLDPPVHYRDERNLAMPERAYRIVPETEFFHRTGIRGLVFNTAFQLLAEQAQRPELLARAHRLLAFTDLLGFWLSGTMANEWSQAGTTGLAIAGRPEWDDELIARLGLPRHIFGPIVHSGAVLGPLQHALASELEFTGELPVVIAPGCHDTASSVAAMPTADPGAAFISCGTWSLMGVLSPVPVTSDAALLGQFSNEIAVDGRIRLLRNIMGLWVWQECRRDLVAEGVELSHAELTSLSAAAAPASTVIDINDLEFLPQSQPHDRMIDRVRRHSARRNLAASAPGDLFRRITEALAAAYADCRRGLERITGTPVTTISLMGGGCQNLLLCQLTANACGLPVLAGPAEGTALGNLLVQARSLGLVAGTDLASTAARSSLIERYAPLARCAVATPSTTSA